MRMLCNRREQANKWETYLCPDIHRKVEELVEESRNLHVGRCVDDRYEVIDQCSNSVDLSGKTCSCRRWQVYDIPCKHACAAIMQTDTNVHRFISCYFTVDNYKLAYSEAIFPIPDHDKPTNDNRELRLRPPVTRRQPGRPRRKRIESQASEVRELRCSRCQVSGHNRRSCNETIAD